MGLDSQRGPFSLDDLGAGRVVSLTRMVVSIVGAKFCLIYGRHRVITLVGIGTAAMAIIAAFGLYGPVWLAIALLWVFNVAIVLDSGALTAGTVEASGEHDCGAILAVHSMIGFAGGALGGPVVGFMLDVGANADPNGVVGVVGVDAWVGVGIGSAIVAIIQWRFWRGGK